MSKRRGLRQFRTVLGYEFTSYLKNKAYVITTLVFVVLIGIGLSVPALISWFKTLDVGGEPGTKPDPVAYLVDACGCAPDVDFFRATLPGYEWRAAAPAELDVVKEQIGDDRAHQAIVVYEPGHYGYIIRRVGVSGHDAYVLQAALDHYFREARLRDLGLAPAEIERFLAPSSLELHETVQESGKSMEQAYLYTYLLVMLLYMTVMLYGQMVAMSVASEKSNRAMEMLITSARPLSLMFGKVIGSGLAGLAQIGVFLAAAGGFYQLHAERFRDITMVRSMFEMPWQLVVYTVVFYLLGYFMYAFLYGALGSLVSRTEDIQTSIMPIVLLLIAAMMVSILGMTHPEATYVKICSFIPFLAPMVMFVRICMSEVPFGQIAASIVGMVATSGVIGYLSARIYRVGVMMYGKPPRPGELIKILHQERRVAG